MSDWLSITLQEIEQENSNTAEARAKRAFHKRANRRYGSFVKNAQTEAESANRISFIEDSVRETAIEVAQEYNVLHLAESLFESAKTAEFYGQEPNPWGPAGGQNAEMGPPQSETCPTCGMGKPVGAPCPHCAGGAPVGNPHAMGFGGQAGAPMQQLAAKPKGHKDGCGCWYCSTLDKVDAGGDTAVGNQYDDEMDGREEGSDKEASVTKEADIPGGTLEYKQVDPDSVIGDSPAMAEGESYPVATFETVMGDSVRHPHEQKDVLDFDAAKNEDATPIKKPVKSLDIEKPIGAEQKGKGGTFPSSPRAAEPVTSRWHVL